MKRVIIGAALVAALSSPSLADPVTIAFRNPVVPRPVNAVSRCANYALGMQLADAVTTRMFMRRAGDFERDPLAAPFIHSDIAAAIGAVGLNLIERHIFRHSATEMCGAGIMETVAVANNVRLLAK